MLASLRPEVAAGLVLRCVVLGGCRLPLNRMTTVAPDAAREFELEVGLRANCADPLIPGERLAVFEERLRRRLDEYPVREVAEFLDDISKTIAGYAANPYDPFEEMMCDVVEAAASLYGETGLTAAVLRAAVPADLVWCDGPPSSFDFAKGVTAQVRVDRHGRARVKIRVCPRRFDAECVLALPYILVHEYVCHGARLALGGPPPTTSSSLFAEGWMDYVAMRSHERLLACLGTRRTQWPDAGGCEDCARQLHNVRHAIHERDDHIASGRAYGREVARAVDHRIPGSKRRAGPLVPVSTRLNGSSLADDDLDGFVFAIARALNSSSGQTRLARLLRDSALSPEGLVARVRQLA